jgi:hypothetical protein
MPSHHHLAHRSRRWPDLPEPSPPPARRRRSTNHATDTPNGTLGRSPSPPPAGPTGRHTAAGSVWWHGLGVPRGHGGC